MSWKDGDLTAQAGAPPAAGVDSPMPYATNLDGQGPVARVLYWGGDLHIHELSLASGGRWHHTDLIDNADAPTATGGASFAGYTTNLASERAVARVVFISGEDQHVHELSLHGSAEPWQHTDLTDQAGAPRAAGPDTPVAYTTNLAGQGPVARVLFRGFDDGDLHELSRAGGGRWQHTDLTTNAQAPVAAGRVRAYTTKLAGQSPVARVLYSSKDSHIHELSLTGGGRWQHTDLTVKANAPAWGDPWAGYTTDLSGQGPVARVLYLSQDLHLHELFLRGREPWKHGDLTAQAHAPATAGPVAAYTTNLAGQGPVARIVYWGAGEDNHLHELSLAGGGRWQHKDLTDKANAPDAFASVAGYTTDLPGQGPVARVLYRTNNHHIHELFTFT